MTKAADTESEVSDSSERRHLKECRSLGSLGHPELQEISKRLKTVKPTVSLYLDELLIQKCKFGSQNQSTLTPTGVASNGPMAPCRSHHRNHTRLEWII